MSDVIESRRAEQAKVDRFHAMENDGWGLLSRARARLQRCLDAGDREGAEYNRRRIRQYERYAKSPAAPLPSPRILPISV